MRLSGIHHEPVKKNNTAKKVVAATLGAAAATAGVLYLAKTGKLNAKEGGNKTVEKIKAALKKPADKILTSKAFEKLQVKTSKLIGEGNKKIASLKEKASEKLSTLKKTDAFANIQKGIDTVKDKIEAVFHPEKFAK